MKNELTVNYGYFLFHFLVDRVIISMYIQNNKEVTYESFFNGHSYGEYFD